MKNNYRVFISYKRTDKPAVFKIKDYIESSIGEECWIDLEGIESDAQFANIIISAIDNSEIVLFMHSIAHSQIIDFDNDWTIRELNYAKEENKRIVFVNIDKTPLTKWFKFMFPNKQQVDASSSESLDRLIMDLKKWLNIQNTHIPRDKAQPFSHKDTVTIQQLSSEDIELLKRDLISNNNSTFNFNEDDFKSFFTGEPIDYIIQPLTNGVEEIPSAIRVITEYFKNRQPYRAAIICVRLTNNYQMSLSTLHELNDLEICASSLKRLFTSHIRNEIFIALFH